MATVSSRLPRNKRPLLPSLLLTRLDQPQELEQSGWFGKPAATPRAQRSRPNVVTLAGI